jgi:PTS system beta-glucosides-specific IIC component
VLIHIGIDTVRLNGEHFKAMVKNGDAVKAGQPLIEFDIDAVKSKGFDTSTSIVITNHRDYGEIKILADNVTEKEPFLKLEEK